MKRVLQNSFLTLVLMLVLGLPLLSFEFAGYKKDNAKTPSTTFQNEVLGASKDINKIDVDIVDKIDLKLNLGKNNVEKFYNVVPEKYLSDEYQIIVVVPDEYSKKGLDASLIRNDLTADLKITFEKDTFRYSQIEVTLIVLK